MLWCQLVKINKLQYQALKLEHHAAITGSVGEWLYCTPQTHPDELLSTGSPSTSLTNSIDDALVFRSFASWSLVRRQYPFNRRHKGRGTRK